MKRLPAPGEIARIRRDALVNRAVEAYKFFYPTVSMLLNFEALEQYGAPANRGFLIQLTTPDIVTLTQNSDTPYGLGYGDASDDPVVVEIPQDGYQVRQLKTSLFLVCARVPDPDPGRGLAFLRTLRMYPLSQAADPPPNDFRDVSDRKLVASPCTVDGTFEAWQVIKRALDRDVLS
jgi:hypothetical protein